MNTNKNLYIVLAVIAVLIVAGAVYWKMQQAVPMPGTGLNQEQSDTTSTTQTNTSTPSDSTTSINQSIDATGVNDVDAQFQDVDADLKTL